MKRHFDFIKALDDFEPLFPVWYPADKKLRNKILDNNLAFDVSYWTSELGGILNAWKAAKAMSSGSFTAPATKITNLGTIYGAHSIQPPPALKQQRQQQRDDNREPPSSPRTQDNGWNTRDSFRDQKRDFREPRECRPIICLICADNHIIKDHPHSRTEFVKGRATFYSIYEGGALKVRVAVPGSERKTICIGWNCSVRGRVCDGSNHPGELLHVCSLCGGDHPALPGNAQCARFRDGAYIL
ncbi:hypothetical protein C8R44DRAFT_134598 [Mycena epipterygia]|nr:hypothetical protein C8R44DRAFT_134598 [Mycena epipterygia]